MVLVWDLHQVLRQTRGRPARPAEPREPAAGGSPAVLALEVFLVVFATRADLVARGLGHHALLAYQQDAGASSRWRTRQRARC